METSAFLTAAEQHKNMVYRIALNYYGNPDDADDTVQDVLLKLYTTDRQFENDEHLRNWLIRVTINQCKNVLRAPWRRRRVAWEDFTATIPFEQPEEQELLISVMQLPEKDRTVLYLFYYEDLSVRDIAQLLHLRESAVTTRLSRARNRLKKQLTEECGDEI